MVTLQASEISVWSHVNNLANWHTQFISGLAYGKPFLSVLFWALAKTGVRTVPSNCVYRISQCIARIPGTFHQSFKAVPGDRLCLLFHGSICAVVKWCFTLLTPNGIPKPSCLHSISLNSQYHALSLLGTLTVCSEACFQPASAWRKA